MPQTVQLDEAQQRRLLANARYADKLLSDIEQILTAAESRSPFPKYRMDVAPHQTRLVRSHIARFRDHLSRVLSGVGVSQDGPQFGSLHSIRVTLTFIRIAVQEMAPEYLEGYGELPAGAATELRGLSSELGGLLDALERNLALGSAADLQLRLDRLGRTTRETDLVRLLDRIVSENELAEFRAPLLAILEKLESHQFEIAVFGRVSSGKSSLLNHILGTDVLPVGVNPITAVPTRIVFLREPSLTVAFADRQVKSFPVEDLARFASEEQNPGNELEVTKLTAGLSSPRLQDGLVLVDTPGLGALATAGAAETVAYLPQCDLGIVLVSAVNPINDEDLTTMHSLAQAGIPVMALLSKADLLSRADLDKALAYTTREISSHLGLSIEVHPVSTVAARQDLLEDWFRDRLAPLFARHGELAQDSIRRKAGALRESVMAALSAKAGSLAPAMATAAEQFQDAERRLREAAARIEESRQFLLDATDEVRALPEIAIAREVEAILKDWTGGAGSGVATGQLAGAAIDRLAAGAASQISGRLENLAHELDSALQHAATALGGNESATDEPLEECVREMPRFQAAWPALRMHAPWFRAIRGLTRWWIARTLKDQWGGAADAAFTNYARSLEAWVRHTLAQLQRQFEARADGYRAQLARLTIRKSIPAEDRARMERDLAELAVLT